MASELAAAAACRPRYEILDGLRGVAAMLVVWYHFFEAFATSPVDQLMNHGYLAVDFFFVLSGFVIGYAYDGRRIGAGQFMLRRVVRLQPMVVLSVVLGAVAYLVQGSVRWDGTPVPFVHVAVALVLGLFMIPVLPCAAADVRGNGEMFPLNGPAWSLFFEYIGSVAYAVVLRRLSARALVWVVAISAVGLACCVAGNMSGAYHQGLGWTLAGGGFWGGLCRLSFSFSMGLLLTRNFRPRHVGGAFWICAAVIAVVMGCPYVGGAEPSVWNGVYDLVCTFFVFPAVVWVGACGATTDAFSTRVCEFSGRMSYPLYIVHYPVMYLFYAWVWAGNVSLDHALPVCVALFVLVIVMARCALKWYDMPVRLYLNKLLNK